MMKNPELAKQMRALRTINGYTQQQIADILNIDRTTYTAYELSKCFWMRLPKSSPWILILF